MDMPTCVGDAYIARLSMIEAERALRDARISMLVRAKNSDRQRVMQLWENVIAESKAKIGTTGVTAQIQDVKRWLGHMLGSGFSHD